MNTFQNNQERIEYYYNRKQKFFLSFSAWSVFFTGLFFVLYKLGFLTGLEMVYWFGGCVFMPVLLYITIYDKRASFSIGNKKANFYGKKK